MKKILVIGCPGAGKSTFARKLRQNLGLPLYYLDMIWHKPDKTNISRDEFDRHLQEILGRDEWIIDGNYRRTLEMRLQAADTVFLLDYPLDVCLAGAKERIGTKREDMPWVETELDDEFRQWIIDFSKDQLPMIYHLLKQYENGREIFVFKSREETNRFLVSFF
ncbi:MAG: adenylate kinase [Lachnospiraceae bacterium]|nr:adenylate kinase [Lachnospiraceae bacterium]